jgi:hypothetical protein
MKSNQPSGLIYRPREQRVQESSREVQEREFKSSRVQEFKSSRERERERRKKKKEEERRSSRRRKKKKKKWIHASIPVSIQAKTHVRGQLTPLSARGHACCDGWWVDEYTYLEMQRDQREHQTLEILHQIVERPQTLRILATGHVQQRTDF